MPILPQQPEQPVLLAETEAAPPAVDNTVNGVAGLSHGLSLGPIAAPQSKPNPGPGPEADRLRMPTPDLAQPLAPAPTLEPEPLQSGPPSSEPQVPIVWTWPGRPCCQSAVACRCLPVYCPSRFPFTLACLPAVHCVLLRERERLCVSEHS